MGSTDSSGPLVVEKSQVILVKPSKPTPEVSLSLSTLDNDPYIEVVTQTIWFFAPKPYLDDEANDPIYLLQNALSDALFYYYPLAGKIHRKSDDNKFQLNCKPGDGVPFIRATSACTLSSLNDLDGSSDTAYQLVPSYDKEIGGEAYDDPLALQVTKFACGGLIIGTAFFHPVCDGVGMTQFIRTMIELASGKTQPSILPVWDRERLTFKGKLDDIDEYLEPPPIATGDMVREIMNITSQDITKLKKTIAEDEGKEVVVTTMEILAAHIWRARCRALNMSPDGRTVLVIIINIRKIMEPPLTEGYYGNAIISGHVELTPRELSNSSLSRVVRLIKDMKKAALDKQYVLEKLGKIEKRSYAKASLGGVHAGFMVLSDWRQIGLHHDAFDGLVNIIPLVPMTTPAACIFLPASKAVPGMSGGIRVLVTLPKDAMMKFKEEMNVFSNH